MNGNYYQNMGSYWLLRGVRSKKPFFVCPWDCRQTRFLSQFFKIFPIWPCLNSDLSSYDPFSSKKAFFGIIGHFTVPYSVVNIATEYHPNSPRINWYHPTSPLCEVPAQHLASLASCVDSSGLLRIENVIGGQQIVSLLTNLKCDELSIDRQSLGREEIQALVQAMQSGVEWVTRMEKVTLDVEALAEYSGQGVCRAVRLFGVTAARYREELRTWASNRNWRVTADRDYVFIIKC